MDKELVSEFEARRVERMLRDLWPGLLGRDETLRVLWGRLQAGWVAVCWELADAGRKAVYAVETRVELKSQDLRERQAIDLLYDFLGTQFEDHLRHGREPFTGPNWEQVEFAGKAIFTRGQVWGEAAERAGDRWMERGT
ncbi:MAG: hypothetical protein FJ100_01580 [Deltaproteobacteria bacterium]|nr:hypothetical protein [Deltaproteobacteria bacterium]